MTAAAQALIDKLCLRDELSREEIEVLRSAPSQFKEFSRGGELAREGDEPGASTLLVDGWAARVKGLPDGRRQILSLHIAGDFIDLHTFPLKVQDHSVVAITDCRVALFAHEALQRITEEHAHLTRLLWTSTLIDSAILREWLLSTGRRSAAEHLANLFCEMFLRLQSIGRVDGNGFDFPLSQSELSDALSLSAVHTNRVLQELRAEGLIVWKGTRVEIPDWDRLRDFASFDARYLHLEKRRR